MLVAIFIIYFILFINFVLIFPFPVSVIISHCSVAKGPKFWTQNSKGKKKLSAAKFFSDLPEKGPNFFEDLKFA
jgi:hypothetical protein